MGSAAPGAPSGGQPAAGTNAPSTPNAGGSFATLGNYLTANQGQAAPLASGITQGINNQYNTFNSQNASTLSGINNQVSANAAPSQEAANATIAQEAANPVSFASNPGNVASFQGLLNASYGGPTSAEGTTDYQKQQNAINSAISTGQSQTQTEAGREQLLQPTEARPTTGVTALNSAILTQDPNALASVQNAYQPFSGLLTNLQSGASAADKQIAAQQATAAQDVQNANQAIASQESGLNTAVQNELTTAQNNAAAQQAAINADLANVYGGTALNTAPTTLGTYGGGTTPWVNTTNYSVNSLAPTTATALGMTPDQAAALQAALQQAATSQYMTGHNFGAGSGTTQIDLSQFLQSQNPNQAITTANVATPQQYAEQQAFQSLLGQLPAGAILNPGNAAQAGTAPTNLNTFDYQNALATAQQAAAAERQAAQAEAAGLTSAADLAHAQSQHGGGLLGALGNVAQVVFPVNYLATKAALPQAANLARKVAHGGVVEKSPEDFYRHLISKFSTGAS